MDVDYLQSVTEHALHERPEGFDFYRETLDFGVMCTLHNHAKPATGWIARRLKCVLGRAKAVDRPKGDASMTHLLCPAPVLHPVFG